MNKQDTNPDPITGAPGSHPLGVAAGGTAGAIAGAVIGSLFGPIGTLIGGGIGAVGGASGGKAIAERVDPTAEVEYWREDVVSRDYYKPDRDFDRDYAPAYRLGTEYRNEAGRRDWGDTETELKARWDQTRGQSTLDWEQAQPAVRDAWERTDRTYAAYEDSDRYFSEQYSETVYYRDDFDYDDYRPAYRYGTQARSLSAGTQWDADTESRLEQGWERAKGNSRLSWQEAKEAVKDAWHRVERRLPGDADGDGR